MTSLGTCLEPQCKSCDQYEYQEKHTKGSTCQRQPFCDPSEKQLQPDNVVRWRGPADTSSASVLPRSDLGFQDPTHDNKKKTVCLCKDGYHCATESCYACEKHSPCPPGHVVKYEGTAHPSQASEHGEMKTNTLSILLKQ